VSPIGGPSIGNEASWEGLVHVASSPDHWIGSEERWRTGMGFLEATRGGDREGGRKQGNSMSFGSIPDWGIALSCEGEREEEEPEIYGTCSIVFLIDISDRYGW